MTSNKIETGKRIRDYRVKNNLTQARFAETLDVSTNFISEIETGKKSISLETLCRVCEKYNLSADYILFGKDTSVLTKCTLSEFLSALSIDDIPIIIEYLEASAKLKKLEQKKNGTITSS
ncbi:MAG: helix-turn-helix transcriptional regulator [Lachnospiraceae bacterium]|nr:helix-turn-helix transcriptional regulator [Lachnospiraceae bacterium]